MLISPLLKTGLLLGLAAALSGCASMYAVNKDLPVPSEVMAKAEKDAKAHRLFMEAAVTMPVKAANECESKWFRLPFWVGSSAWLKKTMTPEQYTAAYKTLGLDEQWRIAYSQPGSKVAPGDIIESIDNDGMGDSFFPPPNKWTGMKVMRSIYGNAENDRVSVKVEVKGKGEFDVPVAKGCAGSVNGFAYMKHPDDIEFLEIIPGQYVVIPASAIQLLETPDEAAFAVLWGYYFTATPEAASAREKNRVAALGIGVLAFNPVLAAPFSNYGYPVLKAARDLIIDGMHAQADLWAMQVMAKHGYDPAAAIRLNEKLAASKAEKTAFAMNVERMKAASLLLEKMSVERVKVDHNALTVTELDKNYSPALLQAVAAEKSETSK